MTVEIGTIVTLEARGSRGDEGEGRIIPAIVIGQHPDGSLQLFAFHFEGSHLVHSIPVEAVQIVGGAKFPPAPKFSLAK